MREKLVNLLMVKFLKRIGVFFASPIIFKPNIMLYTYIFQLKINQKIIFYMQKVYCKIENVIHIHINMNIFLETYF